MNRLLVVGFGFLGASLAAALRATRAVDRVVAIDAPSVVRSAAVRAHSDEQIPLDAADACSEAFARASIVVLAAPIGAIVDHVPTALEHAAVVTDCGSVKRPIVRAAAASRRAERFVPGHPLAGGSEAGAEHARPELFRGRRWIVCPERSAPDAVAAVEELIRVVGAEPARMSAEEHDRAVAITSHVPQLLASALVVLSERRRATLVEGPGFASTTRIAGGNPAIWSDILAANADEVAAALRELGHELDHVAAALERGEPTLGSIEDARRLLVARGLQR